MEWVETTGRTLEEAKDAALDQLGVDEHDAEFEVLAEPRIGLFGRVRVEARVRARVRPTAPRVKEDRRDRRRRLRSDRPATVAAGSATAGSGASGPATSGTDAPEPHAGPESTGTESASGPSPAGAGTVARSAGGSNRRRRRGGRGRGSTAGSNAPGTPNAPDASTDQHTARTDPREGEEVEIALEVQGRVAEEFLRGLADEFGVSVEIAVSTPDPDSLNVSLNGSDLGLLIGPKGTTLLALQDLTRTVVQRKTGATNGRIHVDVAGYRQKRSEALARFAHQVAEQVRSTGTRRALEPMNPADRKVVHDALSEVQGVSTASEGEEPDRRVVILPDNG